MTRSLVRAGILLVAAGTVLAGCTAGGTTGAATTRPGTSSASPSAAPGSSGLLPVVHRTLSSAPDGATQYLDQIAFVDTTGRLVTEPVYVLYRQCPGPDGTSLVVAQADDRVDVLDADGTVVGSAPQSRIGDCGPLPGFVWLYNPHDDSGSWTAALPDLSRSDLPAGGVAVDDDWVLVSSSTATSDPTSPVGVRFDTTSDLVSRDGDRVAAAGEATEALEVGGSGDWPVPVGDYDGPVGETTGPRQGYLDQSGRWVGSLRFMTAWPFDHGYAPVSDGRRYHFVDATLDQVGPDYRTVERLYASGPLFTSTLGYTVTLPGSGSDRTGLLAPDLTVLADPETSRTECFQSPDTLDAACLVVDDAGPRLVALPDGTSTPLPDGFTAVLSTQLVATADGTRVFRTTTGEVFDVPAPFHVVTDDDGWNPGGDVFVVCESDNGLRTVLDATGAVTPLATVEQAVTMTDGTVFFWAHAGDQHGWVDAAGAWIYQESRYQLTED